MKNILLFILIALSFQFTYSQEITRETDNGNIKNIQVAEGSYYIKSFVLKNGLTVILNEDHTMNDILGSVVVKGGSKLDKKNSSGTAHYFEHMMFKGTTTIGTVDYEKEKPYLDSIAMLYDLMRLDKDNKVFRQRILEKIDSFSVIASSFAIPNEFSKLISEMGGTDNNAYTNYENIVYYNHFPRQSLNKWIHLYKDRFENPVFRLFQSELETVYEEKNMALDNYFRIVFEELYKSFYPSSIYGKKTVLGSVDELKNPSVFDLLFYYKENYVANNMALVLIGDFNTEEIIPILERNFNNWRRNENVEIPMYKEKSFKGREVVKKKLTPFPIGVLGYRGVAVGDNDEIVLDVIINMLTNESKTGLIDSLVISQQILEAQAIMDNHYDEGGVFILFVPKLVVQSINNAEKKILSKINILRNNKFDNNLLESCKNTLSKRSLLELENSNLRLSKIIDAYMLKTDLKHIESFNRKIVNVSRNDIVRVANKYFGDNYLSFQSKIGLKKTKKIDKLKQSPLNLANKNCVSKGAEFINNMDANNIEPRFINFHTDVVISEIKNGLHFYYTKNPLNSVFSLKIKIGYGKLENPKTEQLAFYLNNSGTNELSFVEFSNALHLIGSSISFDVDNDYFNIIIDGFDNNFDKTLVLLKNLLNNFSEDKSINKKMVRNNKIEWRILKKDINSKSKLLEEYALYGENSSSLHRLTNKELKKLEYSELKSLLDYLLKSESYIHYVGIGDIDKIKESIINSFPDDFGARKSISPIIRKLPTLSHNMLYYLKDKNAIQTHLKFNIPSRAISNSERAYLRPFNKYFGLGMNSVLFREVREFRSLAYNIYGYYLTPYKFTKPGYLRIALSTQADKTIDASLLVDSILNNTSIDEESINSLRSYLMNSINSDVPSFRNKSNWVQYWQMQGYKQDPRILFYSVYSGLKEIDIEGFYSLNVKGRKYILSIVGDSKRFDIDVLKSNSEFIEVKLKKLVRY